MARETTHFSSQALSSGSWDEDDMTPGTGTLSISFTSGQAYDFPGVPREIWDGLRSASSPGRYYHAFIKGQY